MALKKALPEVVLAINKALPEVLLVIKYSYRKKIWSSNILTGRRSGHKFLTGRRSAHHIGKDYYVYLMLFLALLNVWGMPGSGVLEYTSYTPHILPGNFLIIAYPAEIVVSTGTVPAPVPKHLYIQADFIDIYYKRINKNDYFVKEAPTYCLSLTRRSLLLIGEWERQEIAVFLGFVKFCIFCHTRLHLGFLAKGRVPNKKTTKVWTHVQTVGR